MLLGRIEAPDRKLTARQRTALIPVELGQLLGEISENSGVVHGTALIGRIGDVPKSNDGSAPDAPPKPSGSLPPAGVFLPEGSP